jgi:predicted RecA/RadA family phage recombinase
MKSFVQSGSVLSVAAAAVAVASGQVVVVGSLIGVAAGPAAVGQPYDVNLDGVYEVPKAPGSAWTQGQTLMWDASAAAFAPVAAAASGDVNGAGTSAWAVAASADTKGLVRFAGVPGTVTA